MGARLERVVEEGVVKGRFRSQTLEFKTSTLSLVAERMEGEVEG